MSGEVIWRPTAEQASRSNLQRFMTAHGIQTYAELWQRSVTETEWFWQAVVEDLGIDWYHPYTQVLDSREGLPWTRWFVGGRLNLANDCVDKHVRGGQQERLAIIWEGEAGEVRQLTYGELFVEANRLAAGLTKLGIGPGERVGVFLPMIPETVVALMALAKVGAIFTPLFSGYGAQAIASRLQDFEPKLLITADGFTRRGQPVAMKAVADAAVAACPTIERVLVVRRLGCETDWQAGRDLAWDQLLATGSGEYPTRPVDPEEPFMVIYTSGTTGRPKGAVHTHGGFPIKAAQDLAHCFDLQQKDRIFWLTDLGWMMGPWLIYGSLMLGATMVLYDGAPDYPGPDRLWALVQRHGITHLGLSPTVVRALMPHGTDRLSAYDLSSLRVLGSTGEPWNPDPYEWFFRHVGGGRCPIINYSGGTEISGGILGATVLQPLKATSFSGPVPGMAADVVDADGNPIRGQVGELVIRKPWPGMTRGFWRDRERYLQTYWSRWPDLWYHGDWASVDADGFWYIHGRSDDTIKIAGKRLGPAEVESALVAHAAVAEAAAIGVPHPVKGEGVVVFAVLKPGHEPSEELRQELREQVAAHLGKALRPEDVRFVSQLPRTRSNKVMRRVIRAVYLNESPGDLSALENPDAVGEIGRSR